MYNTLKSLTTDMVPLAIRKGTSEKDKSEKNNSENDNCEQIMKTEKRQFRKW